MTESIQNNAVAAQAIEQFYPYLSHRNRWALLLNLACVNNSTFDLDCKDGVLPPMLSDLPDRQLSQQELQVYLIRHGIPIGDIQTFMEQLCFFACRSTAPDDRIVPLIVYNDDVPSYHLEDCFDMSNAAEWDKTYLTIDDECQLMIHLLKMLYRSQDGKIAFIEPPFYGLPAPESREDLADALLKNKVDPDRVYAFIHDLLVLHEMKMRLFDVENTLILVPPLAYEPRK